jgi:hypothetical protein
MNQRTHANEWKDNNRSKVRYCPLSVDWKGLSICFVPLHPPSSYIEYEERTHIYINMLHAYKTKQQVYGGTRATCKEHPIISYIYIYIYKYTYSVAKNSCVLRNHVEPACALDIDELHQLRHNTFIKTDDIWRYSDYIYIYNRSIGNSIFTNLVLSITIITNHEMHIRT